MNKTLTHVLVTQKFICLEEEKFFFPSMTNFVVEIADFYLPTKNLRKEPFRE